MAASEYPITCPAAVVRPAMLHTWSELSFLHWPFDPALVTGLLPDCVEVDVFDGAAWVGLVPFHCTIRPPGIPRIPWVSSFEEMNVRTYVRGPDGVPGVWFITLDAARLGAVGIARLTHRLTYFWSKMVFSRVGNVVTCSAKRRWPRPARRVGRVALEIEPPVDPNELSELERFLTARWCFYTMLGSRLARGYIEHDDALLARARVLHCDPDLVAACGLPSPSSLPIAHHCERLEVRMSRLAVFPVAVVDHHSARGYVRFPGPPARRTRGSALPAAGERLAKG